MADKVRFGKGVTINIGNYESIRLDLVLEVDVKPCKSREDALQEVVVWVERYLDKEEVIIRKGR